MTDHIPNYLSQLRAALSPMARSERDAVLAEVKDHLQQESSRLQTETPSLTADEADRLAVDAFGPAKEIGVAYGGGGTDLIGLINQETGEKVLEGIRVTGRVAGKVALFGGRGLKGILKFAGIASLVILGIGTILAVAGLIFAGTVLTVFEDDIKEAIPRPLYGYSASWYAPDTETRTFTESFDVRSDMKEFWIDMDIHSDSGCAQIRLLDESGAERYDSGQVCGDRSGSGQRTYSTQGTWQIEYTFVAFDGHVDVDAMYFESAA